jgi:acyl-CoA dehydrogenase
VKPNSDILESTEQYDAHAKHLLACLNKEVVTYLAHGARSADVENKFPKKNIETLRELGFLSYGVPRSHNGLGASAAGFVALTSTLARTCISTSIIWAMHTQQVLAMSAGTFHAKPQVMARQLSDAPLIASVTTERSGAELINPRTPAYIDGSYVIFDRSAPIVTSGTEASSFLTTVSLIHKDSETPTLVLVESSDGETRVVGQWNAMGMRGTQSVPMELKVRVPLDRIIASPMSSVMTEVFIPYGHLGYAAAWYGAARGAFLDSLAILRSQAAKKRRNLDSELLRSRLGDCRLRLHMMECMLQSLAQNIDASKSEDVRGVAFSIAVNNIKLGCSKLSFEVADILIETLGAGQGYVISPHSTLERVFRDLRSASLMYHNDRLQSINGRLVFLEALTNTSYSD